MRLLRSALEHRHFVRHRTDSLRRACAARGDFLRCRRSSGFQTRWAHRLKVYVPACAFAFIFLIGSLYAQADIEFAKANEEYASGHFKEAIAGYESLTRAGQWSANVFYDLGNAYFRAGDFGRAILNYERALALEPHHPEATANLQIARDEARALEMQPSWLERYLQFASVNQYCIAAAIAVWLAVSAVVMLIVARRRSGALIAALILCLLVGAGAIYALYTLERGSNG